MLFAASGAGDLSAAKRHRLRCSQPVRCPYRPAAGASSPDPSYPECRRYSPNRIEPVRAAGSRPENQWRCRLPDRRGRIFRRPLDSRGKMRLLPPENRQCHKNYKGRTGNRKIPRRPEQLGLTLNQNIRLACLVRW